MEWCSAPLTNDITTSCSHADAKSPLWKDEALCGQMNVLRRRWGIADTVPTSKFWSAWFVLDTDVDQLVASIKHEAKVRVVVIESDRRCIIVGHPAECKSLATSHGISLTPFSMSLLAHCDWVPYELAERAGAGYYNEAVSGTISEAEFSKQFANMYSQCVDFRGKVRTAYDQGCRIFLEVGCDNKRTGAVSEILAGHSDVLALAMDGKVGDPRTQHRRVWAQLISHGFELSADAVPRTLTSPASGLKAMEGALPAVQRTPSASSLMALAVPVA